MDDIIVMIVFFSDWKPMDKNDITGLVHISSPFYRNNTILCGFWYIYIYNEAILISVIISPAEAERAENGMKQAK